MADWLYNIFATIFGYLNGMAQWVQGRLYQVWLWAEPLLADSLHLVWTYFKGNIPHQVTDVLDSIPWSTMGGYIEDVSWMLPVVPCFTLLVTAYTACGFLRLLRWTKSFIPTISGS